MKIIGFPAKKACKIVGITYAQIHHWDKIGIVKPSIMGASGTGSRRVYSFADIIGLEVAAELKRQGLSIQKIRKSVEYLKKNFPDVNNPITNFMFISDGISIFILTDDPNVALDTLKGAGQFVFSIALGHIIAEVKDNIIKLEKEEEKEGFVFEVKIAPENDGRFHAWCPALKGCHTWGHTEVEAFLYIKDAVTLYVQDLFDDGEPIPGVGKADELKPIIIKLVEGKAVKVA